MHRHSPARSHTGSLVVALALVSLVSGFLGGLIGPEALDWLVSAVAAALPSLDWSPLGWVGDALMRLFSPLIVEPHVFGWSLPTFSELEGRTLIALVCGIIPAAWSLRKARNDMRFRAESFRGACVSLAASVRASVSRGVSPVADVAHAFLASRGVDSDVSAPSAPARIPEPDFAEAEAAAAAMLGRLAQREGAR
jgi:hypothetical protein